MVLLDGSAIGGILTGMNAWTGDVFLSLLIIYMLLVVAMLAFRVPVFLVLVSVIPFVIAATFITTSFLPIVGAMIFYLAILIARVMLT